MRILVTNDDGINAPGLWKVADAMRELGDVVVVAPDRDQSESARLALYFRRFESLRSNRASRASPPVRCRGLPPTA